MRSRNLLWVAAASLSVFLSACGGGGGSAPVASTGATTTQSPSLPPQSMALNQVPVTVDQNPAVTTYNTVNQPFVTVTICDSSGNCQNIDHVLVDTGSYGLRLMASAVTLNLPQETAPAGTSFAGDPVGECASFLTGYMWGSVRAGTVKLAGETASNLPIQIVGDTSFASVPSACSGLGVDMGTVTALGANGIIGVGLFNNDGQAYYACAGGTGTTCSVTAVTSEVSNPVAAFSTDNNGVILQMQAIPSSGQATATGTLTFGVDTQADNSLSGYSILPADAQGYIAANLNGQNYSQSFIDSGSNFYYLNLSGVPTTTYGSNIYYAPASPLTYSATLSTTTGGSPYASQVAITDPTTLNTSQYAYNDVATLGPANTADLGMPFFYGKSVAYVVSGKTLPEGTGPFYAVH